MIDAPKGSPIVINIYDWIDNYEMFVGDDKISFDPKSYFITSGDAVQKTIKMIEDLKTIDEYLDFVSVENDYEGKEAIAKRMNQARQLLAYFKDVRGEATFLEIEWNDHTLYATPKNPRSIIV